MNKNDKKVHLQKFFASLIVQIGMGLFLIGLGGILLSDLTDKIELLLNAVILVVVGKALLLFGVAMYVHLVLSHNE